MFQRKYHLFNTLTELFRSLFGMDITKFLLKPQTVFSCDAVRTPVLVNLRLNVTLPSKIQITF